MNVEKHRQAIANEMNEEEQEIKTKIACYLLMFTLNQRPVLSVRAQMGAQL